MYVGTLPFVTALILLLGQYEQIVSSEAAKRRLITQAGKDVVLQPEVFTPRSDCQFLWWFYPNRGTAKSMIVQSQVIKGEIHTEYKGIFKDLLLLDRSTGSLTIRNITDSQSGLYHLQIIVDDGSNSDWNFNCSVYAPVSAPNISKGYSLTSTQTATVPWIQPRSGTNSQSRESCQVLCSVKNDREVSLSWFRGNETHSQISSPDVNVTLSLSLEIDDQDTSTYRCVSANPVSNDTTYLSIPAVCSNKAQKGPSSKIYYVLPIVCLSIIAILAIIIYLKRKKGNNNRECTDHTAEEPQYAALRHRTRINIQNQDVLQEATQTCETIYSGVVT